MPITACCFNSKGNIFAYTSSYDWSKVSIYLHGLQIFTFSKRLKDLQTNIFNLLVPKGHEYYNPQIKPKIFLRNCTDELKPRKK